MWSALNELADGIEPTPLREVTRGLMTEHAEAFQRFPAAVSNHHAYLGGLLEHTLEVSQSAADFARAQPGFGLHIGLVIAGAILHDIGKLIELENPIAPSYSFSGQLIGHLLLGRDMLRRAAEPLTWSDPRLPELLEHIIVSHHGELEYAAAMVPKIPEALVVYYFDNLSAKLNTIRGHVAADATDGDFTDWERTMARRFFKGKLVEP
jgi:3'-5' exoribonuclease